jgi:hypothetical protein
VINLGTNDLSTNTDPTAAEFESGYRALLQHIREKNPDAYILCTNGPMLTGTDLDTIRGYIDDVVEELAAKLVVGTALLSAASVATYVAMRPSRVSSPTAAARAAPRPAAPLAPGQRGPRSGSKTGDLSAVVANDPSVVARPPKAISSAAVGRAEPAVQPIEVEPSEQDSVGRASFPDPSIAEEARLLERARAALAVDPAGALRITEEHARKHPMAQLSAERELIAIDALMRLGRRDEALRRAAPGLARAPNSLYAKRLRPLLGQPEPE